MRYQDILERVNFDKTELVVGMQQNYVTTETKHTAIKKKNLDGLFLRTYFIFSLLRLKICGGCVACRLCSLFVCLRCLIHIQR